MHRVAEPLGGPQSHRKHLGNYAAKETSVGRPSVPHCNETAARAPWRAPYCTGFTLDFQGRGPQGMYCNAYMLLVVPCVLLPLQVVEAFKARGTVSRKAGSGRPRKSSKRTDRHWVTTCLRNDLYTAEDILKAGPACAVSVRTVQRRLCENGRKRIEAVRAAQEEVPRRHHYDMGMRKLPRACIN